jgi:hypothetical protein
MTQYYIADLNTNDKRTYLLSNYGYNEIINTLCSRTICIIIKGLPHDMSEVKIII